MESPLTKSLKSRDQKLPRVVILLAATTHFLLHDLGGGSKSFNAKDVVTVVSLIFLPVAIFLQIYYKNDSLYSWSAVGVFSSYTFTWPLRNSLIPDINWNQKITKGGVAFFAAYVSMSLSVIWFIASGYRSGPLPVSENLWMCLCIIVYVIGLKIFWISDVQKYFTLQHKKELITTGMFKYIRHPNYLGQGIVYISFAMLAFHWIPLVWYIFIFLVVFVPNGALKEAELSKLPGWAEYRKRTKYLIPWIL